MENKSFGELLREKRQQSGLSQYQLGKLLKVSNRAVSKWENDLAKPKSHLLYRLSVILGISVDELLSGCERTSHQEKESVTAEQCKKILHKAYSKLMDQYNNMPPIEVINRFESEKLALMRSDILLFFDLISQISEVAEENGCPIQLRGGIGASFVAYLLGASDVNPLPAHYYCPTCKTVEFIPEVHSGWELPQKHCAACHTLLLREGHNIPFEVYRHVIGKRAGFDLVICRGFLAEAEKIIMQYFSNSFVTILNPPPEVVLHQNVSKIITYAIEPSYIQEKGRKNIPNYTYEEYYEKISDKPYINLILDDEYDKCVELEKTVNIPRKDINFLEEKVVQSLINGEIKKIPCFGLQSLSLFFDRFSVQNLEDVLQLYGMALCVSALTEKEAMSFVNRQTDLTQKIIFRDDVYQYVYSKMKECEIYEFGLAFIVMDRTRKGTYYYYGMDMHTHKLLSDIGVSEQYIECLEATPCLYPKAQGVMSVRYTLILLWYQIHYPKEFQRIIIGKTNDYEKN